MSTDVFNSPSNDYVNPALPPCAGLADDSYLEFLPNDTIGVIQGSKILGGISFSDLKIPVHAFNTQKKILSAGEVSFIGGLTKGLQFRTQVFAFPYLTQSNLNPYFMDIDFSIGYYKNFKYYNIDIEASGNYNTGVTVDIGLSLALNENQIKAEASYDPSSLTISGTTEGYDFTVSNVILTLIDASQNANSPFPSLIIDGVNVPQVWTLEENISQRLLYAKYPNTGMQGIIMKGIFPVSNSISTYDKWFYVNHVNDIITIYDPIEIDNFITNLSSFVNITFDPSISWGPFVDPNSATISNIDISFGFTDAEIAANCVFTDGSIFDSGIWGSDIKMGCYVENTTIEDSWINAYILVIDASGNKQYIIDDPSLNVSLPANRVEILATNASPINDCSINNALIIDVSIYDSYLQDSSLTGCTLYNCLFGNNVTLSNSLNYTINQTLEPSVSYDIDSSIFYTKTVKTVDVGMNGTSTPITMSAGDYLDWVQTNGYWNKVGDLYAWTSAPDTTGTTNLIDGFYVYNPHNFDIQLEYLTFI
jgi:hypothetical protein